MDLIKSIYTEIYSYKNEEKARILSKYFQVFPGGYGENDIFLGVSVPILRKIAYKYYKNVNLNLLSELLSNNIHEFRMVSLMILDKIKVDIDKKIDFYIKHLEYINNWDLIDCSAPNIIGAYLYTLENKIKYDLLLPLIISKNIWHQRIAMMSTFYLIKKNDFELALDIAQRLIESNHKIVQKAVGWMLREIGKRDINIEKDFLTKNIKTILPIAFQYSIEKFSKQDKDYYKSLRKSYVKKSY